MSHITPSSVALPATASTELNGLSGTAKVEHRLRVLKRLKQLGANRWAFRHSELLYLPEIIHPGEEIGGIAFGKGESGFVVFVATARRMIFLDKKPFMVRSEDISYDAVTAVSLNWIGISGTLVVHTRVGDFKIHTLSRRSATIFHRYIEQRCIEHANGRI